MTDTTRTETLQGHTPGPWKLAVRPHGTFYTYDVRGSSDKVVADRVTEANARLIAAAPDMLEVLKKIYDEADHILGTESDDLLEVARQNAIEIRELARAAIAKATNA